MKDETVFMEERHIGACAQLFVRVFAAGPWCEPWTEAVAAERLGQVLETSGGMGLVWYEEGKVTGFLLGLVEAYYTGRVFHLKEMCVAIERQRRGVGKMMMARLEVELGRVGIGEVYLQTWKHSGAEAFYRRMGFRGSRRTVLMVRRW